MDITGKLLGNRYEIIKEIGNGGMAYVYLARCRLLNREVAVKVLRPELAQDKEFLRRFEVEAQAAACLSHPNIVSVYDVGKDGDLNYIIMEYVQGRTLKEYMDENGILPWREAVGYAMQICEALRCAHKNGVVHRDIKPHNIIMTNDGVLKVTDFGIACAVTKNTVTISGNAMGSVHYFSPEQARGGMTDAKSDIYSLGVVMYEMLTGRLPFDGESHVAIAIKHIQEQPVPMKEYNLAIPLAVEAIVSKAMEKRREDRYASAGEMLADLHAAEAAPDLVPKPAAPKTEQFDKTVKIGNTDEILKMAKEQAKKAPEPEKREEKEETPRPEKTEAEKKSDKKTLVWAAVVSVIIVIIFGVGIAASLGAFRGGSTEARVPSVEGEDYEEMKEKYAKQNINIVLIQEVDSSEYEAGIIVKQDPKAGTNRKTPFDVSVTVSKGAKTGKLSNYVRQEYSNVEFELKKSGFEVERVDEFNSSIPKETVIRTDPKAGTTVETGSKIYVYVSKGPELSKIPMPKLVDKSYADAKAIIENNNLRLGETKRTSSQKPSGTVIGQSIEAGTEVDEYTVIDLTVSTGASEDEPSHTQAKTYTVPVPKDKDNTKIVVVQNGSVIHNAQHNKSEGQFTIELKGSGSVKIEVYYDDVISRQDTVQL